MTAELRVLMVEDSEDDALLLTLELERAFGHVSSLRVDTPGDFRAALEKGPWDLVLSDHRMPRFNSTDALAILRESGLDLPFIIVSGSIGEEVAVAAMRAGANDYLLKSNLARLAPAIERELRETQRREANRKAEIVMRSLELENARVAEASRTTNQFLANVSHELRTPLNAIIGFSELLIDGKSGPLNDAQRQKAEHVHEAGLHLLKLIDEILDLARVEAGKMKVICAPCDPLLVIRQAVSMVQPLSHAKQISLSVADAEQPLPAISIDAERMRQVLLNLIGNAIKFTPAGGAVTVRCMLLPETARVRIEVIDSGAGISAEDLKRLFVPFIRLDSARQVRGTGLGLALVKQLVELMGGTAGADSTLGVGSRFFVDFPVA
jgi:signal transduction histidine kinase